MEKKFTLRKTLGKTDVWFLRAAGGTVDPDAGLYHYSGKKEELCNYRRTGSTFIPNCPEKCCKPDFFDG